MGGHGTPTLRRVARYCDGWLPIPMRAGDLVKEIAELRALLKEAGRDPDTVQVSTYWTPPDLDVIRSYADAGVTRVIFGAPSQNRETVLPLLDHYASVMKSY